ncbi:MAG: SRPBCC family protein [Umezawaea sp.]
MIDIVNQLKAIHREVGRVPTPSGEVVSVVLRRDYDVEIGDLWEALTDPERVARWFLPLTGDLRVGGSFQLEGNAGGDVLDCRPPRLLKVTFGGPVSVVELRLSASGGGTALELEHTVPIEMAGSGAGALYVGPGWDGAFLALALFFASEPDGDPIATGATPEAQEFSRQSVQEWVAAIESSGTASAEDIAAAVEVALAQFAPDQS